MPLSDAERRHRDNLTEEDKRYCEDLVRSFAAELIGTKVDKDGCVPGWSRFLSNLHPEAQKIVVNHYQWLCAKVVLRNQAEAPTIARAVASCRHALATFRPAPTDIADAREIASMVGSIGKHLGWTA